MAGNVAADPIPTSSMLMAASKQITFRCRDENVAFLKCKKKDPNPEKCLDKGRDVTRCVFSLPEGHIFDLEIPHKWNTSTRLKDLQQKCNKEVDAYAGCMYYHTNEFEFCRKEQEAFEKACPFE